MPKQPVRPSPGDIGTINGRRAEVLSAGASWVYVAYAPDDREWIALDEWLHEAELGERDGTDPALAAVAEQVDPARDSLR